MTTDNNTTPIDANTLGTVSQKEGLVSFRFESQKVCNFLTKEFGISRTFRDKDVVYLQNDNNIISELMFEEVKEIFNNFIRNNTFAAALVKLDTKGNPLNPLEYYGANVTKEVQASWTNNHVVHNKKSFFEFIKRIEVNYIRDTADTFFSFHPNGFVKVDKEGVQLRPYTDLPGYISKEQILPYPYQATTDKAEAETYVELISKKNDGSGDATLINLKYATGYLLHNWHGDYMVLLSDSKIGEHISDANGRTGKDLFNKILGTVVKKCSVDGKSFDPENRFRYDTVSEDVKIVAIEDAKLGFKPDWIFNDISNGIKIDRKNRQPKELMGPNRPKILVSLNHAMAGTGQSYDARQFVIELGEYFNGTTSTPFMHFGHLLITSWSPEEFNRCYNFLYSCVHSYLNTATRPTQVTPTYEKKRTQVIAGETLAEYYNADNLAKLILISQKGHGIDLYNEFQKLRDFQILDKGCEYQPFIRKLNRVMKEKGVLIRDSIRKDTPRGKIRCPIYKAEKGISDPEVLTAFNELVINEDPKTIVKEYTEGVNPEIEAWKKGLLN